MSKNQFLLQISALESLQVNFNCFNSHNICFGKTKTKTKKPRKTKKLSIVLNDQALKQ